MSDVKPRKPSMTVIREIRLIDFDDSKGPVPAHRHSNGGGWVADSAQVEATAYVNSDARVFGNAKVLEHARIEDYARVSGDAVVRNRAVISEYASITDGSHVSGSGQVSGHASMKGQSRVFGSARVLDEAKLTGRCRISGNARVGGRVHVGGKAVIHNSLALRGSLRVLTSPLIINGLTATFGERRPVPVVITDEHMQVGVISLPTGRWSLVSSDQIAEAVNDREYVLFWSEHGSTLSQLARQHAKNALDVWE